MKILAIETTDQSGSVALLDGRQIVSEARLPRQQRSAQSLAPAIAAELAAAGWLPNDIQLVAVAIGPGSFTGLRVGVTTAKTFAYAIGSSLVGVPTLEIVAAQAASGTRSDKSPEHVICVLDAGRLQTFSARYQRLAGGSLECVEQTSLVDDEALLANLPNILKSRVIISGPGLRKLGDRLPGVVPLAPEELWNPHAATVGQLALARYERGQRDDPWQFVPLYHRASAAEEKLAQAISQGKQ